MSFGLTSSQAEYIQSPPSSSGCFWRKPKPKLGTDLHQIHQLLQDLSNHQQALPCHGWQSHETKFPYYHCPSLSVGWGSRWPWLASQPEKVFFRKLYFLSDKRIFLCQPQRLGGIHVCEGKDRKVGVTKGRTKLWKSVHRTVIKANNHLGLEEKKRNQQGLYKTHIYTLRQTGRIDERNLCPSCPNNISAHDDSSATNTIYLSTKVKLG